MEMDSVGRRGVVREAFLDSFKVVHGCGIEKGARGGAATIVIKAGRNGGEGEADLRVGMKRS